MTADPTTLIYAYGVVAADFGAGRPPAGLDGRSVEVAEASGFRVLITRLPATVYDPDTIARMSGDVSWLSPRAMAHDQVLTWAQERGGVVPFPMFTMFGNAAALNASLASRADSLRGIMQRVAGADEFGVRVHRREDRMLAGIHQLDPALGGLRAEAAAASPGQRYLLERKLAERSRAAVRAVSQRLAAEIFQELRGFARDAVARPLTPDPARASDATLVLNGAFLVDRARVDAFRAAVGARMRTHEPHGLEFDFTGPWPAYNFVSPPETP